MVRIKYALIQFLGWCWRQGCQSLWSLTMMKLCVSIGLVDVLLVSCGLRRRCVQRLDGFPQVRGDSIRQTCVFRGFRNPTFCSECCKKIVAIGINRRNPMPWISNQATDFFARKHVAILWKPLEADILLWGFHGRTKRQSFWNVILCRMIHDYQLVWIGLGVRLVWWKILRGHMKCCRSTIGWLTLC